MHDYDWVLEELKEDPAFTHEWPADGTVEAKLFNDAAWMAALCPPGEPDGPEVVPPLSVVREYLYSGFRLDGWSRHGDSYTFAFRHDKDLPYVVEFHDYVEGMASSWTIKHWEV